MHICYVDILKHFTISIRLYREGCAKFDLHTLVQRLPECRPIGAQVQLECVDGVHARLEHCWPRLPASTNMSSSGLTVYSVEKSLPANCLDSSYRIRHTHSQSLALPPLH
eukprot:COSAG01_NODE_4331_length_5128_cov_8.120501_3_plen_110_part_00